MGINTYLPILLVKFYHSEVGVGTAIKTNLGTPAFHIGLPGLKP